MAQGLAIDPGGVHCGMAQFRWTNGKVEDAEIQTWEEDPEGCVNWTADAMLVGLDVLVIEEFRLYPWESGSQSWSDFPTVEVIGVLKYLAKRHEIPLVIQPALIKKPTRGMVRAMNLPMTSKRDKTGGHAADAELHAWRYLLNHHRGR